MPRKVKVQHRHKGVAGSKGLPSMAATLRKKRQPVLNDGPWTMEEKLRCLEIYAEVKDKNITAARLNRSESAVKKFLWRYQSTTLGARMKLEAGAEKLADNIVKNANVEESLEVMDRLGVLEKKRPDAAAASTSFSLIIGMPSTSAQGLGQGQGPGPVIDVVPVPPQPKLVEEASDGPGPR